MPTSQPIPAIFSFTAAADISGYRSAYPILRLICGACGKPLYGDWAYNFSAPEAHAGCVKDGILGVQAQIDGLLGRVTDRLNCP